MTSPFWTYFADKLHWPQAFAPGPLQALVRGLAHHLDTMREDMPYLRQQFFPGLCEGDLVPEYGLSRRLVRHPRETPERFRQRVVHAYGWHMLGGKTLGLPQILRFYGFDIVGIDSRRQWAPSHWAEFELQLKSPVRESDAPDKDFDQLVWLVNEYKPARSILFRAYNDLYDRRFIIWTRRSVWSRYIWSFNSGVRDPETGVIVSFGRRGAALAALEASPEAFVGATLSHGLLVRYVRSWIWSYSRWSDLYPPSSGFVHGQLGTHLIEREDRPWLFRGRRVAREQLVWSGADVAVPVGQWGDINCRWSKGVFLLFSSPRWGLSRWSGCGRRLVTTLERRLAPGRALAPYAGQSVYLPGTVQAHAVRIELYPNHFWLGAWDSRLWNPTPPVPHRSTATRLPRLRWSSPACGWGKAVW